MQKIVKMATASVFATLMLTPAVASGGQPVMPDDHSGHTMHSGMMQGSIAGPTEAGQDAFGTIQEIITILTNDPDTDWSRVNITVLREHLVDMNDLTLKSKADARKVAGGLEILITGEGRVREAIGRMIPAHAPMLVAETGWQAVGEKIATGARLTVTSDKPADVVRIRALGFYGLMAMGGHHQGHHLGMARGQMVHGG